MRLSSQVVLATHNRGKLQEFRGLFSAYPAIELIPADQVIRNAEGLKFAEKYDSYLENAISKARMINKASHYPALADDSGLEVSALEGRPGVRSHRYAPPQPHLSQDQANIEHMLKEMKSAPSRSARFVCTLALVIEGILLHSTGILNGTLLEQPKGGQGFGYDPIFVPTDSTKTLAEMSSAEKNKISHRTQAFHALMAQVKAHGITFAKP